MVIKTLLEIIRDRISPKEYPILSPDFDYYFRPERWLLRLDQKLKVLREDEELAKIL